jgi:hypothetical protein
VKPWALLALGVATSAQATEVSFIACPVYRDTDAGKKSGCWLADDPATGIRYDVTPSAAKPDWNRAVLVEGRASSSVANPCGGAVLDPVRSSVLEDIPCPRHMLPAEGFPGRKFVLPQRNVDPMGVPRPAPVPPFENRVFRLFFDWNSDFVAYQREDWSVDRTIAWIRGVPVRRITVTGFAARSPVTVSGQSMAEAPGMGRVRAAHIAEALTRLGIPEAKIAVRDGGDGKQVSDPWADDLPQASRRRVEIAVEIAR